jgi:hypothetical protein
MRWAVQIMGALFPYGPGYVRIFLQLSSTMTEQVAG